MANVDRVHGFRPVRYRNGTPWNGAVGEYVSLSGATSAIFVGDLVALGGDADVDGRPNVLPNANIVSGPTIGVAVGFGFNPNNLNIDGQFRATGAQTSNRIVYVVDDPNVIFEVQGDSAMDLADVGYNASVTISQTGSVTTGQSGMELDASTVIAAATSNDRLLRIIGFSRAPDNDVSSDSCKVLVTLNWNKHQNGGNILPQ